LRFHSTKRAARSIAVALALGVTGVLLAALPALAAADTISSFTPTCGAVGTSVTITGTGFTTGATASAVIFPGNISQAVVPGNDTTITTTVPAGSTGTAALTVVDADGNGTSAATFTSAAVAIPTITSFTPLSGAVGTSVVITGTNFGCTSVVKFNATNATTFTVNSATQITASVPTGATTGKITVTNTAGSAVSTADFTVLTGIPTVTSFSPTAGDVGTSVVITGTNLAGASSVKFNGTTATFTVNSATQITATVPAGATTGSITVTNALGTGTSATSFTLTTHHNRTVNLNLKKHLEASGTVTVSDGFNACRSNVTVKIQRLIDGNWKVVGSDQTSGNGKYKTSVKDKAGKYRAVAKKENLNGGADICNADTSATRKHHH